MENNNNENNLLEDEDEEELNQVSSVINNIFTHMLNQYNSSSSSISNNINIIQNYTSLIPSYTGHYENINNNLLHQYRRDIDNEDLSNVMDLFQVYNDDDIDDVEDNIEDINRDRILFSMFESIPSIPSLPSLNLNLLNRLQDIPRAPSRLIRTDPNTMMNNSMFMNIHNINILIENRYNEIEYNKARKYYNENIKTGIIEDDDIDITILNAIIDYEENGVYPSLDKIVECLFLDKCRCLYDIISDEVIKNVYRDVIREQGRVPSCREIPILIEYYVMMNNRIPSNEEFNEFIINRNRFNRDPEEYFQNDKQHIPFIHVDKLPTEIYNKKDNDVLVCGICQCDFEENEKMIILTPCMHKFHNNNNECLGISSIRNWLMKESTCPMCKTRVKLNSI